MKVKNILKVLLVSGVATMMVGCASVGGMANHYVNDTKKEGVFYGARLDLPDTNEVCDAIKNKDERCLEREKWKAVSVMSRFGYSDAFTGTIALAPKEMDIGEFTHSLNGFKQASSYTYLKAKVEFGRLGTVLEIASRPGDEKCHWSGMPRAGSTVCPAYNYDASRDFNGMPR